MGLSLVPKPRQLLNKIHPAGGLPLMERCTKDVSSLKGASKAALRGRSQAATVGVWLSSDRQSGSSTGLRVCVI